MKLKPDGMSKYFDIWGRRQRWQKRSRSEPGSRWLQRSPGSSPEEPVIRERYQTMNHLLPSLLLPSHAAPMPGRPPACSPLSGCVGVREQVLTALPSLSSSSRRAYLCRDRLALGKCNAAGRLRLRARHNTG
ncbi:hypothetical protein EYF80_006918 [Liparis tanakae]|uniref:Uncharacterized protein n=1 Tax=Liparis tanakae TaxID=230148 RepID=A0A4Z2IYU6_9TELE|nr:hypothetical protein EYF80_006918 [Liparis tanakae]